PFVLEAFMDTWAGMEALHEEGLVRHIGTSNMTEAKLRLVLPECRIRPTFNEMELHPTFSQEKLRAYLASEDIMAIGFSPLGSPNRPERDTTAEDIADMQHPVIVEIAQERGVHPATICLQWAHQHQIIPIPLSTRRRNLESNFQAIHLDPLSVEELARLATVESGNRLIKGQVFLWEGAESWRDLWDEDGVIKQ
ncbi:MAG TPA: aldo/keto reductase, partial [Sphaerochaeta sp.]|nr:aldo/keto reductase [Sphaerochaeta sp.]